MPTASNQVQAVRRETSIVVRSRDVLTFVPTHQEKLLVAPQLILIQD